MNLYILNESILWLCHMIIEIAWFENPTQEEN